MVKCITDSGDLVEKRKWEAIRFRLKQKERRKEGLDYQSVLEQY